MLTGEQRPTGGNAYDKEKMNKVNFAKNITENDLKKENFIYSFLSSIRQKINKPVKRKK